MGAGGQEMSIIRVNPDSIREYARNAQAQFEQVRAALQSLTADVVGVRYFGPNAYNFKVQTGELAAQFSQALLNDVQQIAQAVSQATSNISSALGGQPVTISVDGSTVPLPAVEPGGDVVDIDTSALDALKPRVTANFATIESLLRQHLERLQGTDWQGQAKLSAVDEVSGFTRGAQARVQDARQSIESAIEQQISAVLLADR
jgi:uncharacterized protein YukE